VDVARGVWIGSRVCVADGASVSVGCGKSAAVGIGVDAGEGEKSRFATGEPNTTTAIAITDSTREVISHCQPITMRARRVR
jgi:hypothetical protein